MSTKPVGTIRSQNSVPSHPGGTRQSPPRTTSLSQQGVPPKSPPNVPEKASPKKETVTAGGFDPEDVFSDDDDDGAGSGVEDQDEDPKPQDQQTKEESSSPKELKIDPMQLREKEEELRRKAQNVNVSKGPARSEKKDLSNAVKGILENPPTGDSDILRDNEYLTVRKGAFGMESATIKDSGVVNVNNIKNFNFEFGEGSEKTDSIEATIRNTPDPRTGKKNESYVHGAQIATRDVFVVYPNGDKSTNIIIEGCVLVRTKPENAGTESKYGSSFIKVGIPSAIIDKMMKRAADSDFNAKLKGDVPLAGGYYWVNSDCSKAPPDAVAYIGIQNNKLFNMAGSVDDAVTGTRINEDTCLVLGAELKNNVNFLATAEFKLNMSFNRTGRGAPLDVTNIPYNPSFKLKEAHITDDTTACPPPLITGRKGKDRMTIKKSTVGASLLAKITKDLKLTDD